MKRTMMIGLLLAGVLAVASCGEKNGGDGGSGFTPAPTTNPALWEMQQEELLSKVEVYSGETLVESYTFTYDTLRRVTSVVRADNLTDEALYNLRYTYSGDYDVKIAGTYYGTASERTISATVSDDDSSVEWLGDWDGAWKYTTCYDEFGVATSTSSDIAFEAKNGKYSSSAAYLESYKVLSNDITYAVIGTSVDAQTSQKTAAKSSSDVTVSYEYDKDCPDLQNFGVFLINCELPVWYAKSLPGCKHLITGASMKFGSLDVPYGFRVSYELDTDGNILSATRTDFNGEDEVLTRTYRLYYE